MKSKVTTTIDECDNIKLERMAKRAGMTKAEAVRVIYTRGVAFFLSKSVGATR